MPVFTRGLSITRSLARTSNERFGRQQVEKGRHALPTHASEEPRQHAERKCERGNPSAWNELAIARECAFFPASFSGRPVVEFRSAGSMSIPAVRGARSGLPHDAEPDLRDCPQIAIATAARSMPSGTGHIGRHSGCSPPLVTCAARRRCDWCGYRHELCDRDFATEPTVPRWPWGERTRARIATRFARSALWSSRPRCIRT
jgi:hypothetical protein